MAERDREALLRICPMPEAPDVNLAKRFNIEFRGADATASPYLQLGMLIRAGLDGIKRQLPPPILSDGDPGALTEAERRSLGIGDLPHSMGEALDALESNETAMGWLGPELSRAYLMHKRGELAMATGMDLGELYRLYALAY